MTEVFYEVAIIFFRENVAYHLAQKKKTSEATTCQKGKGLWFKWSLNGSLWKVWDFEALFAPAKKAWKFQTQGANL